MDIHNYVVIALRGALLKGGVKGLRGGNMTMTFFVVVFFFKFQLSHEKTQVFIFLKNNDIRLKSLKGSCGSVISFQALCCFY